VPPLPPHISFEFARNTAEALIKGDPNEKGVIVESAKALVTENVAKVKEALHLGEDEEDNDK
jgi:pyruvate dehydrogenase (quinone)